MLFHLAFFQQIWTSIGLLSLYCQTFIHKIPPQMFTSHPEIDIWSRLCQSIDSNQFLSAWRFTSTSTHVTHFQPMFNVYTPWKQKTSGFWCFQGVWKWNISWKWLRANIFPQKPVNWLNCIELIDWILEYGEYWFWMG